MLVTSGIRFKVKGIRKKVEGRGKEIEDQSDKAYFMQNAPFHLPP
jgi:hypothetical protein